MPEQATPTLGRATLANRLRDLSGGLLPFLALLLLAEVVAAAVAGWVGLLLHVALVLWLAARSATAESEAERRLLAAFVLAPLVRVLSLSLPLSRIPESLWQGFVAVAVLLAAGLVMRQLGLPLRVVGVSTRGMWLQIPLGGMGLGLGALGFAILSPIPATNLAGEAALPVVGATLLIAAFSEELVFRGVLLSLARPVLGRGALVFVAVAYTALQVGHGSMSNLVLAFITSLLYAYLAQRGCSIIGISLAHGLTNLMLFLVLPQLQIQDTLWVVLGGTAVGLLAASRLVLAGEIRERRAGSEMPC